MKLKIILILAILLSLSVAGCIGNTAEPTPTSIPTSTIKPTPTAVPMVSQVAPTPTQSQISTSTPTPTAVAILTPTPTTSADIISARNKADDSLAAARNQYIKCTDLANARASLTEPSLIKQWFMETRLEWTKEIELRIKAYEDSKAYQAYYIDTDPEYLAIEAKLTDVENSIDNSIYAYNNAVDAFNWNYGSTYGYIEKL